MGGYDVQAAVVPRDVTYVANHVMMILHPFASLANFLSIIVRTSLKLIQMSANGGLSGQQYLVWSLALDPGLQRIAIDAFISRAPLRTLAMRVNPRWLEQSINAWNARYTQSIQPITQTVARQLLVDAYNIVKALVRCADEELRTKLVTTHVATQQCIETLQQERERSVAESKCVRILVVQESH